jgi:hypothetical protein
MMGKHTTEVEFKGKQFMSIPLLCQYNVDISDTVL